MPAYTLIVHMYAKKDSIEKLKAKLQEASQVYSKDKECLSWSVSIVNIREDISLTLFRFIMQDHKDPQAFSIVERYAHESSQK